MTLGLAGTQSSFTRPVVALFAILLLWGLYDDSTFGDPYAITLLHGYDHPIQPGVPTPSGSKTRARGSFVENTLNVEVNANLGCPVPALSSMVNREQGMGVGTGHSADLGQGHI